MSIPERIYRTSLWLYPDGFLRDNRDAMQQLFRDQLRDADTSTKCFRLSIRTILDLFRSVPMTHLDVVQEERRMRTESNPIGRLIEAFQTAAFTAHPYGHSTVGHMSDLQSFTRKDAHDFYKTYYVPFSI